MISSEMAPSTNNRFLRKSIYKPALSKSALTTASIENIATLDNTPPADWFYTRTEDIANTITHAIGILLSFAGLLYLLSLAEQSSAAIALGIYGLSSLAVYTASTAYHFVQQRDLKIRMRTLDHCSIYLLIAGSYTPYLTLSVNSMRGTIILAAVWCVALIGVTCRLFDMKIQEKYALTSYLCLGWAVLFVLPEMLVSVPQNGMIWFALGGLFYMSGIIFYKWYRLPFNHAVWHIFVLGGSICHFYSILTLVSPA